MMSRMKRTLPAILAVALAACGDDVVSYSQPVGISLSVRSADVVGGAISVDKNVNTETGNPYGAFVAAAEKQLGRPPSRIAVTALVLGLEPGSTVSGLEQVLTGAAVVSFQMNGSGAVYPVGSVSNPAGASAPLAVAFDSSGLPPADYASLTQGQFKVELDGSAAAGFDTGSQTANLEATFTFVAYE